MKRNDIIIKFIACLSAVISNNIYDLFSKKLDHLLHYHVNFF